jgi:hypothetical protein
MVSMSDYDTIEIEVCVDCLVWFANGDLSGIDNPERELEVITAVGIDEGYDVVPGDYDSEPSFSHSPCDACRNPQGGTRVPAVMIQRLPHTERKDS